MERKGKCNDRNLFAQKLSESVSLKELGMKLGYSLKGSGLSGGVHKLLKQKIEEYKLNDSHLKGQAWAKGLSRDNNTIVDKIAKQKELPWNECFRNGSKIKNQDLLKKLVKSKKREYKCERCGIKEWQGEIVVLEIHHINNKFNDNQEENLQILCPNCHSHTRKGKWTLNWLE